jgi:hypothetical protein
MANVKISELPQASVLSQDTIIPIVSGSTTYKVNLEDLNIIEKTKAEIDTLVGSNNLIPGQLYKITGVDTALYGGTDILIKAATTNKLELAGHGIFYNPKYLNSQATPNNGYGIWSNYITLTMSSIVGTFTNGDTVTANNGATATYLANGFLQWISGNWSAATSINNGAGATANVTGGVSPSYAIGQDAIWGGKHWTNTSGNAGTATNKYTLSSADWTAVAFNSTDYNVVADVIHYDYDHDMIIRRKDKWNNDVDGNFQVFDEFASPDGYDFGNPIKDFQWGNGNEDWNTNDYNYIGVQSNYVKDSYLECINFIGSYLWYNTLTNSYMYRNITDTNSRINNNTLTNSNIYNNTLTNNGSISGNTLTNSNIEYNTLTNSSIYNNTLTNNGRINNNTLTDNSNINSNTLTSSSFIQNNTLTNNGSISGNTLTNSNIYNNTLTDNGRINNNTLTNSNIYNNTLTNNGRINNNTLTDNSNINSNTLTSSSFIQNNTLNNFSSFDFSSSGTLTSKTIAYIEANYANAAFNISAATIIFTQTYSKQMFRNSAGTTRLGYYNGSDVFTVVNVNA